MKIRLFSGRQRLLVIVGLLLLVRPGIAAIPDRVRVEQGLLSGIAGASAGVRVDYDAHVRLPDAPLSGDPRHLKRRGGRGHVRVKA